MNMNLTLIGQAISFAIFVWFCLKYVWPPVLKALEERESRIADGLAAAERGKHELELAEQRAGDVIRDGKDKAQDFITQAQKRADEIVEAAKATAREEAERIKKAKEDAAKAKKAAGTNVRSSASLPAGAAKAKSVDEFVGALYDERASA